MAWYWWVAIVIWIGLSLWGWAIVHVGKKADERWDAMRREVEEKAQAEKRRRLMTREERDERQAREGM